MDIKCKECGTLKTPDQFYKNDKSCKECRKEKVRKYRALNIEKVREYDRARGQTEARKQKNKEYQSYMKSQEPDRWRKMRYKTTQKNKRNNHDKYIANSRLSYAVRSGKIKRGPCSVCGAHKIEGHHPDYTKPLEVIWLCDYHHKEEHKKIRDIKRAPSND